ncbi:coiled-coil domain-containing protein 127-like [Alosa sapidissima]|uniref:coiled-coil domain-containing protein 127-like n=1 Tax=Alosa sapidissima TaxID=34773 RepID=UPI001C0999F7|nr:coiled-coil domain-containing protein 127-like [Alosa sapidissima]
MNNLSRGPDQGAGGDNSKWNYAYLIPMLGFGAIRWLWSKMSQLEQDLERERKSVAILKAQRAAFHKALDKEGQQEQSMIEALRKMEEKLVKRQSAFCSILHPPEKNVTMLYDRTEMKVKWSSQFLTEEKDQVEKDLRAMVDESALASLGMKEGLGDIFAYDTSCAVDYPDKDKNGSLMWVYLDYWRLLVELQKHQRAKAYLMSSESAEK